VINLDDTSARIKQAMEYRDIKQAELAQLTGISKGALSSYISGRYAPKQNNIYLIAQALSVSEAWLMGANVSMFKQPKSEAVCIPVLGRVAAGIPISATEYIIDTEEISQEMANDGEYFALQIKGDSMEPKISTGDVVIVRKQEDADDGDLVIALINGDDAVCKRLKKYAEGLALVSTNPAYEPLYFTQDEVINKPVQIIGKVKELRAKF
jgi:repressor LexA